MKQKGFTMAEMTVALAIGSLILLTAMPAFTSLLARSRVSGAARQLVGDIQAARQQAITSGWETKIIGFGGTSTNAMKNQYRMLARRNSGTAWPSDTAARFRSSTQWAEAWVNVTFHNPGVTLDPGGSSTQDRFEVAFDSRGTATASSNDFSPFRCLGKKNSVNVTVSAAGGISTGAGAFP